MEQAKDVLENLYDGIAEDHELEEAFLEKAVTMDEEARNGRRSPVDEEKLVTSAVVLQLLRQHGHRWFPPGALQKAPDSSAGSGASPAVGHVKSGLKKSPKSASIHSQRHYCRC